jgi:hypothetical protein
MTSPGEHAPTSYHQLARKGLDPIAPLAEVARLQAELKEVKPWTR